MSTGTKTDNHRPATKLPLRRRFLGKYHAAKPPRVLDCFQDSGLLWLRLLREFELGSYWGVDLKPKKGQLKIDSSRILEQRGWEADVVDLDAYGSPWTHWRHLVRTFTGDAVTVFLTIGMVKVGGGGTTPSRRSASRPSTAPRSRTASPSEEPTRRLFSGFAPACISRCRTVTPSRSSTAPSARTRPGACAKAGTAFFYKQSPAARTEMGITLDGKMVRAFPVPR